MNPDVQPRHGALIFDKDIRITCPCDLYPLASQFYIVKPGFTGVYAMFLFLLQNIDCGYSLEPPHQLCSEQKYEKSQKEITENCHFYIREKLLYIAWACFRNVYPDVQLRHMGTMIASSFETVAIIKCLIYVTLTLFCISIYLCFYFITIVSIKSSPKPKCLR